MRGALRAAGSCHGVNVAQGPMGPSVRDVLRLPRVQGRGVTPLPAAQQSPLVTSSSPGFSPAHQHQSKTMRGPNYERDPLPAAESLWVPGGDAAPSEPARSPDPMAGWGWGGLGEPGWPRRRGKLRRWPRLDRADAGGAFPLIPRPGARCVNALCSFANRLTHG